MAMAAGVTTTPAGGGDGARSEVAKLGDFLQQGGFLVLESGQRIGDFGHMGQKAKP